MSKKVRVGIVGYGNMGSGHSGYLSKNEVAEAELSAICDIDPAKIELAKKNFGDTISYFDNFEAMIDSGKIDLVIIATPHYFHPPFGLYALEHGVHVLSEKPIGVYTKDIDKLDKAAAAKGLTYGIMFQQRTINQHIQIKKLIDDGVLGSLRRMVWIVTNWYRSQSYYDSGGWRATWAGEGGGVLLNQCPHNLDLWQWFFGMPESIRGFAEFGKYRNIEVEDDVTAYMKYKNGATGVLITTTGETPGTNRLEVSGDNGKLVFEDGTVTLWENEISESEFNRTYTGGFGSPKVNKRVLEKVSGGGAHSQITQNVVNNILHGEPLIARGGEGINGLSLSNAIYLSTWTNSEISFPINADQFLAELKIRIASSKAKENFSSGITSLEGSSNT
ncbi:oxidoreductase [Clostridia bacterium]|nr:oxidoreductase [Clostridia bacterium]